MSRRAAVVGAGIVGLSVAWFLQEHGFEVTVFDAGGVAAGASAGNAGWITPGMAAPLPEPGLLGYALRSIVRRDSPLRVPPSALPATGRFLAAFAMNCTPTKWKSGADSLAGLCALALSSYDRMERGGVTAGLVPSAIVMAFRNAAEVAPVEHELRALSSAGISAEVTELSQPELRADRPVLSSQARHGLKLGGQRYLQPLGYMRSLAASVQSRGGAMMSGARVRRVESGGGRMVSVIGEGSQSDFDVAVLATGAWLSQLSKSAGVRPRLAAGRGYSFTVPTATPLGGPLYLPSLRVACTPVFGGMRVAGTMEFRPADSPLDRRRIDAIVRSARDYLDGVDWAAMREIWVGPRPVTADGLPLIGATGQPGVYVAGGHGMWGMTLGPATGRLLARFIATGERPQALGPFDPCR